MCGIHYILSKNSKETEKISSLLIGASHRGPDGSQSNFGNLGNSYYAIGHNLLSVVDVVQQPLVSDEYCLSYNGELYNYLDLAKKYSVSNTKNDATVLFELLKQKGMDILPELNGMFAFIWIDKPTCKTYLARDYFGQKPLYYSLKESTFKASSVQKKLVHSTYIHTAAVREVLMYKSTHHSIYDGVSVLEAGHYLCIDHQLDCKKFSFEIMSNHQKNGPLCFENSITSHCIGKGRPAVLVSGGLDSSLILHTAHSQVKNPIAYTLDTSTYEVSDDVKSAKKLCHVLGVEHQIIQAERDFFDAFIDTIDQPIGNGAFYFQYLLAKQMRKNHTYALSGNGADELFGGYQRHNAFRHYHKNKKSWLLLAKLKSLLSLCPGGQKKESLVTFLHALDQSEKQTFINFTKTKVFLKEGYDKIDPFNLQNALDFDVHNYLKTDVLATADQSSMAFGLEIRSPFIDADLYAWSKTLSPEEKLLNHGKFHLKALFPNSSVLNEIKQRKKVGFGISFTSFWGRNMQIELLDLSSVLVHFVTNAELLHIQQLIKLWKPSLSNEYWAILILCKWLKNK